MEAVVLTNDYLPRPGVDIFPICKKAFNVTKVTVNGKDPINFLKLEEYQESTSEHWDNIPPCPPSLAWCDEEETVGVCIINTSN